jgi:hypothetical protein
MPRIGEIHQTPLFFDLASYEPSQTGWQGCLHKKKSTTMNNYHFFAQGTTGSSDSLLTNMMFKN